MEGHTYYNPYWGSTFWGVLIQLAVRLWEFVTGNLSIKDLASDEIQILVLAGVAASSALVGSFLVLRKMTMLANSLSHTILVGIVAAFLLTHHGFVPGSHGHSEPLPVQAMLIASVIMGIVTAFLTEILTKGVRLQEDASTGL